MKLVNMKHVPLLIAICFLNAAAASAVTADFDGDGVADEYTITREAEKVAKQSAVKVVNPWLEMRKSTKSPKGLGLVIGLSKARQKFLVHDAEFFSSPMWKEGEPALRLITKKDKQYADWKKQVPDLRGDAIEIGTEAGINILLYWDGRWQLFWPDEEP
jgi:hypothetical protein